MGIYNDDWVVNFLSDPVWGRAVNKFRSKLVAEWGSSCTFKPLINLKSQKTETIPMIGCKNKELDRMRDDFEQRIEKLRETVYEMSRKISSLEWWKVTQSEESRLLKLTTCQAPHKIVYQNDDYQEDTDKAKNAGYEIVGMLDENREVWVKR